MAVDRKQQMKEITERLEQGVKDIFTSEMYTTYLRTMAKFHNYSFNNTLLIAMQRPDATLVAGFNAWKNKFNRYVKKGEKGIQIIAPAPIKEVEEREKIDKDTGLAVLNENGEPEMERVEYVVPCFRVTTVFDVSQTDGEPIPSLEVNELTASVKDYALLTAAIEQVSPVPMRFDEIEGEAKGYYSDADKEICIQVGMGESQTIKTMIHEVAHAMLHNSDFMKQNGEEKDRLTKETEAESIAFTVCSALGIDTSDYSFPYVASWASGKEMKELKDSMDTIRLTAADFLEKLETAVAERSAERMTAMQYAEKLIANREQEITIFDDEQRNLIVNFAFKLDDRAATEELVNGLAAALAEDDKEEANRLMYEAQEKIENLPDRMIGLSEMHDYGYLNDDVLPLTKEGAREWHRLGERIYPLFRDGTAGDYVSQEEIEQHDGIFGIKADAWDAILLEQREDYAEVEYARPDFQLTVINREQALRLYDEGKQIYLVRISPWPILVTAREEIERGSDTFQIAIADLEQGRNMTEQENVLLYGSEKQFGIYQITERDPEHDYRFMGLDYVQKKGIMVTRADYDLIYTAPLTEKDTLDGIYERFNIQRPADFTGHSLSVSDVVVLNDGNTVKAYYVDPNKKRLALIMCPEEDSASVEWARQKGENWVNKDITSLEFVENIFRLMNWNRECRYKVLGRVANSDQGLCMLFDLEEAIMFTPKPQEYADPLTGEMKKKQMKFFPDTYRNRIGKSYNDYIADHQMNMFEDFIGYQGSAVLDEPVREEDSFSKESMSQESEISENILLPDLAKQSESIEQQSGEIAERGMPT